MALSREDDEIASQYRKMIKMGMPEGAVMQKMSIDGVAQNIQDAVLEGDEVPGSQSPENTNNTDEKQEDVTEEEIDDVRRDPDAVKVPKKESITPNSYASFYEEIVDNEEGDQNDGYEEEIVEEEVVFDDDDDDQIQHQAAHGAGIQQSYHSQYTEESYYGGSTNFNTQNETEYQSSVATAASDVESQRQQQIRNSQIHQSQQQREIFVAPRDQKSSVTMSSLEKTVPSPSSMWYWLTCLSILLLLGGLAGVGYWFSINEDGRSSNLESGVTDSPTLSPVEVSSEWDPVQGNCDLAAVRNPNPLDQCDCFGSIREIPRDIQERYFYNRESFISDLYENYSDGIRSCNPRNQALVWVSSGNDESLTVEERMEKYALATIFASLAGTQWSNREDWLSYGDPCNWFGVGCTSAGLVVNLLIPDNNAEGLLPGEISLLERLRQLDVSQNAISGPLPPGLFMIRSLEEVNVSSNQLDGVIPPTVSKPSNLKILNVANNAMSGRLTTEIGEASQLERLDLNSNMYEGSLPFQLFQLSQLTALDVGGNNFVGAISHSISQLSALQELTLGPNFFSGTIQSTIRELTNLKSLAVQGIDFTGRLPASFGFLLTNLESLVITNTQIEGNIDTSFGNLPELTTLDLSSNQLRSVIPSQLGSNRKLVELRLQNNFLDGQIPVALGTLTALQELRLDNNLLSGGVPASLSNLNDLRFLRLETNRLQGRIIDEICALRDEDLIQFVVDCPLDVGGETFGLVCAIPECCTSCENLVG